LIALCPSGAGWLNIVVEIERADPELAARLAGPLQELTR
jgi:hypothetical protein